MSLINQMLKDLARRSRPLPNPDAILSGLTPSAASEKNKFHYLLIVSSIFFVLVVMTIFIQKIFFPDNEQHVTNATKIISQPTSISNTNERLTKSTPISLPMNPVSLTGITLQVQKEMTNLRLLLNQNTLYRITGDGQKRLAIVLENTRLITVLPQVDTVNSAVKMIRMTNQADGSLKIILSLNEGAELRRVELNELEKLPELQIDFSYDNPIETSTENSQTEDLVVVDGQQKIPVKKISYDTSIDDEYQQAMQFLNLGQPQEALTRLTQFLEKYPTFVSARKSYAALLLKEGKISKAQEVIDLGLAQQPLYPPYVQLKAQILVDKGKIKQALYLLEKAPPPLEQNPDYHALLAALYQRENKSMLAEKLYEQLVTVQPNNSIWWMGLGIARETLRKNKQALEAYVNANNRESSLTPELKIYVENRIHALS